MLKRKKTKKTGLDAILEVAGATMGNLGANLANMFDAEGAEDDGDEDAKYLQYQLVKKERRSIEQSLSMKQEVIFSRPRAQQLAHLQAEIHPPTHQDSAILNTPINIIAYNSKETTNTEFNWRPNMAQTTAQPSRRRH